MLSGTVENRTKRYMTSGGVIDEGIAWGSEWRQRVGEGRMLFLKGVGYHQCII